MLYLAVEDRILELKALTHFLNVFFFMRAIPMISYWMSLAATSGLLSPLSFSLDEQSVNHQPAQNWWIHIGVTTLYQDASTHTAAANALHLQKFNSATKFCDIFLFNNNILAYERKLGKCSVCVCVGKCTLCVKKKKKKHLQVR